jgi:5-methylcytosine-specific restriction endonuclease McrA
MSLSLKKKLIKNGEMIDLKKCKYCKSKENLTIDHKIPIIKGGLDERKNLQCLCYRCNSMKSGMTDGTVRAMFRWFLQIQEDRIKNGAKPFKAKYD